MIRQAVILSIGSKYCICCDLQFIREFYTYVLLDANHSKEMRIITDQIKEGIKSKKYGDEPYGTKSMKPFNNRDNDRIICNVLKRPGQKQCIIMSEIYRGKKSQKNDKTIDNRYKIVSKYSYEIIT